MPPSFLSASAYLRKILQTIQIPPENIDQCKKILIHQIDPIKKKLKQKNVLSFNKMPPTLNKHPIARNTCASQPPKKPTIMLIH